MSEFLEFTAFFFVMGIPAVIGWFVIIIFISDHLLIGWAN